MRANLDLFHRARDTDNAGDVVLIATAHEADRWPRQIVPRGVVDFGSVSGQSQ